MPDYGHDLRFGVFITPLNDPPRHAVDLAVHAEGAGIDLVTFQDHPYQPRFHDTWTLLTWVAAETSNIRLAANVHNLPLRPPAVLARAAASLDILSGGRFELGLGAGGFWDAIEAMGGPRRDPGEAVDSLADAIDVVRGIWDTSTRERLEAGGDHYRISGAKRGPSPAHEMEIWVGAYGPRMMRLIGEKADGWLPSLGRMSAEAIAERSSLIDEAAAAAGRDPSAVRRLVNLGLGSDGFDPARLVRTIVSLATDHGFSAFILASDDPGEIETYATEVSAAVREEVGSTR
jgi:alkanesulfonate monooxygenase SsuD/methylene tetrahydromethanopterin reductase-like flavin-dependent oxidoreductase (luciferase family)